MAIHGGASCRLAAVCLLLLELALQGGAGAAEPLVPAMFVFGDSLTDNGNNNDLNSLAKANYPPYGIDFAGGPTGRFSNGYTMVDEIGTCLRRCMHAILLCYLFSDFSGLCSSQAASFFLI